MDRAVDAVNLGTAGGDLSLWGLFMQADIVVKLVMIGLLAASVFHFGTFTIAQVKRALAEAGQPVRLPRQAA